MARFRIQPHSRLQEWVADEKGYFADEGLDYEFIHNQLMNERTNSVGLEAGEVRSGAFELMEAGTACEVGSACHWAVNQAAATRHGRMWPHAYSVTPGAVLVPEDSEVRRAKDLAGIPIAVGYHSGSHFSTLQALEPVLPMDQISTTFVGGPQDRVALALDGELEAVNVFGAALYTLEQLGFRKVVDTSFMIGFIIDPEASTEDVNRYFRALRRAQRDIDAEPERYKHYFLKELPERYHSLVDVNAFGTGERIVFEPYTEELFTKTQRWMADLALFPSEQQVVTYEEALLA